MISGLPSRSRSACSLSSAASLTSSLPVPRQAISAGEKFAHRQAAFRHLAPVGVESHRVLRKQEGPPKWRAVGWKLRMWECAAGAQAADNKMARCTEQRASPTGRCRPTGGACARSARLGRGSCNALKANAPEAVLSECHRHSMAHDDLPHRHDLSTQSATSIARAASAAADVRLAIRRFGVTASTRDQDARTRASIAASFSP